MKRYLLKTNVYYHNENDRQNFWIDNDIIEEMIIEADSINDLLERYSNLIYNNYNIAISKNTLKNKKAIYRDIKNVSTQVGFCLLGKIEVENKQKYIDLWIEIFEINYPKF